MNKIRVIESKIFVINFDIYNSIITKTVIKDSIKISNLKK